MIDDIRYATRSLVKKPGFTAVAIITLALGIGASTAIFSVVDAVLLRPLPFPQQERIVEVRELSEQGRGMSFADPNFDDLRQRSKTFEALARYGSGPQAVVGGSEPVRTNVCIASADFFRVLGVQPLLGRTFSPEVVAEDKQVAVVSFGFWKRFLGERQVLDGTIVRLQNRTFAVIGVLPAEAEFPPGIDVWTPAEIYPPVPSRTAHNWRVAGRLRAGVTLEQAAADALAIGQQLKREHGASTDAVGFGLTPLRERFVRDLRSVLLVVGGAVGLLLLISCSNVANLLLARALALRHQIAVRAALGASRWRLARQFIAETTLLTLVAAALGVAFAFWGVDLILGAYHGNLPRVGQIGVNATVLLFTISISALLGLGLGLLPAFSFSPRQLQDDLQSRGRAKLTSRSNSRVRSSLVIAQVALTLMLLIGAGLLGRSFQRLMEVSPGFEPDSTVAMELATQFSPEAAAQREPARFYRTLIEGLQTLPGVIAVGGISFPPMSGTRQNGAFIVEDGSRPAQTMAELSAQLTALSGSGKTGDADYLVASGGYFDAMRIPLLRGRVFGEADGPDSPHAAVISESLARRHWPGEDPIGRQIQFGNMDGDLRLLHIVGVVGDVRAERLDAEPRPTVYTNYLQRRTAAAGFCIVLRARTDATALIGAMRREARALDPEMPIKFRTLREIVSASLDHRRFSMVMLGVFAGAALVLAMVGLYGVLSFITSERTSEIGIRMALGAQRTDMLALILRQSFTLVTIGIVAGVAGAFAATRVVANLLYGVGTADIATYIGVIAVLAVAALVASYIPARRAMNVDPMVALRHE